MRFHLSQMIVEIIVEIILISVIFRGQNMQTLQKFTGRSISTTSEPSEKLGKNVTKSLYKPRYEMAITAIFKQRILLQICCHLMKYHSVK